MVQGDTIIIMNTVVYQVKIFRLNWGSALTIQIWKKIITNVIVKKINIEYAHSI